MADSDGVLLVYNPDAPSQDQQLVDWFEFFVRKNGLKDEQCMVFVSHCDEIVVNITGLILTRFVYQAHRSNPSNERFRPRKCSIISIFDYMSSVC